VIDFYFIKVLINIAGFKNKLKILPVILNLEKQKRLTSIAVTDDMSKLVRCVRCIVTQGTSTAMLGLVCDVTRARCRSGIDLAKLRLLCWLLAVLSALWTTEPTAAMRLCHLWRTATYPQYLHLRASHLTHHLRTIITLNLT
jgi:hypothetical protein